MAIPPLVLKIVADSAGVKKGVAETEAQVSGLKSSVSANAALMKTALIGGVVVAMGAAVKAASDMNEAQNKVNVIFGRSAQEVTDFAETTAESFAISKTAALDAASGFGNILETSGLAADAAAGMSKRLVALAGDMASFNNIGTDEALEKIRSGLVGEAEPLRTVGVLLSETRVKAEAYASGIAKAGAELTEAQKVQARYNLIMADSAKQQGDFGRTSDSLANQTRMLQAQMSDLAAEIGQKLLPVVVSLLQYANKLVEAFLNIGNAAGTGLGQPLADVTEKFGKLALEQGGLNLEGRSLVGTLSSLKGPLGDLGREVAKDNELMELGQKIFGQTGEAGRKAGDNIDQLAGSIRRLSKDEKQWAADTASAFGEFVTGTTKLKDAWSLTTREFEHQMDLQVKIARQGFKDIRQLGDEAIPIRFKEWLVDQGPAAVHAFVQGSAEQQKRIVEDWQRSTGFVERYSNEIRQIPKDVRTDVHLNTLAAQNALRSFIANASGSQIDIYLQAHLPHYPGRQHGGPVLAGRPYVVGERGPELFVPSSSGQVAAGAGGGTGVTVNIGTLVAGDSQQAARTIRDELLKLKGSRVSLGLS